MHTDHLSTPTTWPLVLVYAHRPLVPVYAHRPLVLVYAHRPVVFASAFLHPLSSIPCSAHVRTQPASSCYGIDCTPLSLTVNSTLGIVYALSQPVATSILNNTMLIFWFMVLGQLTALWAARLTGRSYDRSLGEFLVIAPRDEKKKSRHYTWSGFPIICAQKQVGPGQGKRDFFAVLLQVWIILRFFVIFKVFWKKSRRWIQNLFVNFEISDAQRKISCAQRKCRAKEDWYWRLRSEAAEPFEYFYGHRRLTDAIVCTNSVFFSAK